MKPAQVLAFEQDLSATVEAAFAARNRLIKRRARRWDDRGLLSYRAVALLSATALLSMFLLAPFWAPHEGSSTAAFWWLLLWFAVPPIMGFAMFVAQQADIWLWEGRIYPLSVMYDRAVLDLLDRCAQRGLDKRQVKYLFSLSRADASLNISFLETIWKYGGSTAAGVLAGALVGARAPWYIAILAFTIAILVAVRIATRLVDPAIRLSQLAASVEHHCR